MSKRATPRDAVIEALALAEADLNAERILLEHYSGKPALGIRQTMVKVSAALTAAKAGEPDFAIANDNPDQTWGR